jgi:hypothetical protein
MADGACVDFLGFLAMHPVASPVLANMNFTAKDDLQYFPCEKVGNSEKSSEALKIQNGQFEKKK